MAADEKEAAVAADGVVTAPAQKVAAAVGATDGVAGAVAPAHQMVWRQQWLQMVW